MIAEIGGGAAGMMAAISAAEHGAEVVLFERNPVLGKKVRITGKGRCNLTNACDTSEIFENIPTNGSFLYSAIYSFTNFDAIDFFEHEGVKTKVERGERVFPVSDKASDIVDAMHNKIKALNIKVVNKYIDSVIVKDKKVCGVKYGNTTFNSDSVIIACGGKSYPVTGSDGSGYALARLCGHSITEIHPALIPVETVEDTSSLMGLSLRNVSVSVKNTQGKKLYTGFGEMLITHFGLSGPLILSASSHMGRQPQGLEIEVDLKPALDENKLDSRILRDFEKFKNKNFDNSLSELLPSKMIPYVIKRCKIDPFKKVNAITKEERKILLDTVKHLTFTVKKYRPVEEAIVTSGGVNTKEINSSTMESKLVEGLYFAGEVIDVDAYTGGFNLQIAFSTGHLAGEKAAQREDIL